MDSKIFYLGKSRNGQLSKLLSFEDVRVFDFETNETGIIVSTTHNDSLVLCGNYDRINYKGDFYSWADRETNPDGMKLLQVTLHERLGCDLLGIAEIGKYQISPEEIPIPNSEHKKREISIHKGTGVGYLPHLGNFQLEENEIQKHWNPIHKRLIDVGIFGVGVFEHVLLGKDRF